MPNHAPVGLEEREEQEGDGSGDDILHHYACEGDVAEGAQRKGFCHDKGHGEERHVDEEHYPSWDGIVAIMPDDS